MLRGRGGSTHPAGADRFPTELRRGAPPHAFEGLIARVCVLRKAGSSPSATPRPGLLSAELRAGLGLFLPGAAALCRPQPAARGAGGDSHLLSISQRASPRPAALRNTASPLPHACRSSLSVFSRLHQCSQRFSKQAKC